MKLELDLVDEVFHFKGQWDIPSLCGLKIARHEDRHVVIATELFDQNPGSSITEFAAPLAGLICREFDLDPDKLIFVEHCPKSGSKLENYEETFHRVALTRQGDSFCDPDWSPLSRAEAEALLG